MALILEPTHNPGLFELFPAQLLSPKSLANYGIKRVVVFDESHNDFVVRNFESIDPSKLRYPDQPFIDFLIQLKGQGFEIHIQGLEE